MCGSPRAISQDGANFLTEDLTTKSATEMVGLIRSRAVSPVEVVEAHLRRIEKLNPHLNAIVTLAEDAMDRAREAEANPTNNPLHGLRVTINEKKYKHAGRRRT